MDNRSSNTYATSVSMKIGGALLVGMFALWVSFPIPPAYQRGILLCALIVCIGLITALIYQSQKTYINAQSIAEGMAQDMLVYSHELFSELYRSSPVPYILIDIDGHIESVNFSTARLFNVEINALNGLDVFTFIEGDDEHRVALIPEYFKQGKFVNDSEVFIRRPDGLTRWVMLSLFSFTDTKKARKGLLTLVDVTKQKMVDKAKTEFVSLASHQLRTPISGIKWNIELLATSGKELFGELQNKYIDKIQHGIERMDMLVNDFLNVSKLELGTLTPVYTAINPATFLIGIRDEHATFAEQKAVRIETDLEENIGDVQSDSHLLHMITSNLLGNAIKYTPSGGVVRIQMKHDQGHLLISFSDTGMGIPADDQEMIFSKMFRASNARAQVTDGTGLGLYIVKEAVEILGGTVTFESKEAVGTTFTVTLPG